MALASALRAKASTHGELCARATSYGYARSACQFAREVKGVDLRSTAGNCAWVRTPQLTSLHPTGPAARPACTLRQSHSLYKSKTAAQNAAPRIALKHEGARACSTESPQTMIMKNASAGNRTWVTSMATMYSTTRPLMLLTKKIRGGTLIGASRIWRRSSADPQKQWISHERFPV